MTAALFLAIEWPTIVFPLLIVIGLITMGVVWFRHKRRKNRVEAKLAEYKQRVVRSSDVMDELRERHRKLPVLDDDYTVPMQGETLAEYNGIQSALDRYRDQWLELMDVWDNVQTLVESEGTGRQTKFKEASALLEDTSNLDALVALESECRQRVNRLETAHEQARTTIEKVDELSELLVGHLEKIEERGLTPAPYQLAMDSVAELTDQGKSLVESDPLAGFRTLSEAKDEVDRLIDQTENVIAIAQRSDELDSKINEQLARVTELKSEGHLFAEPDISPASLLEEARTVREDAITMLNRGTVAPAEKTLGLATSHVNKAIENIDTCVEMRTANRSIIDERRTALRRLLDDADAARLELTQLEASYPQDSWLGVTDNLAAAGRMVATMNELLDQAQAAASDDVQHYTRAQRLIDEVNQREGEVAELITAVAQRRAELDKQRDEYKAQVSNIEKECDRIGNMLRESRADRDLCNNRYRMAKDRVDFVVENTRRSVVDWPWIGIKADECQADFQRVEELFRQDLQLHKQAQSEINEAQQEIRTARSFYRAGVSADVSEAARQLSEAERSLTRQEYERAVKQANESEQLARDAQTAAKRQMEVRQRRLDQQRREHRQQQMRELIEFAGAAASRAISEMSRR